MTCENCLYSVMCLPRVAVGGDKICDSFIEKSAMVNAKEHAVDEAFLSDWYINSVDNSKEPVWTDPHIEELLNDFIVIPKEVVKDEL